jgi:hypothetical protein
MMNTCEEETNQLCGRVIAFVFVLAVVMSSSNALAGQFRASVVKVDITPDKPQWLLGYDP